MSNHRIIFDYTLPLPPRTWKRARSVGTRRFNEHAMEQAKSTLGWEVKAAAPGLRCSSSAEFGFRATFHIRNRHHGDGDRYENLLMDALQGIVWENDEQVMEGFWRKVYDSGPALTLTIWRIE